MKAGDKVICIDAVGMPMLKEDKIYTVLAFSPRNAPQNPDGIKLVETKPPLNFDGFRIDRFRKIDTDWADELLKGIQEEELVNVC